MVDDIRKLVMPIPFNPPSAVLFQLLGFLVDAGKGVIQTSFEKLSDNNNTAPVGTTLALIEQGMVVFSSIHSRLHNAMARCFRILHRLNGAYLTDEDIAKYNCGIEIKPSDFDGPSDVIPVSDPAIFSETQRFAQVQAVQQRAAVLPQMYDARKVEEMFLRTLKIHVDDVLVSEQGKDDRDPVSENVAATMGQPIYVLPGQDHVEHIKLHFAYLQSPLLGSNPAIVKTFLWPMAQHLRDHVINFYMSESHKAVAKARQAEIPLDDSDAEVQLVLHVQQAIEAQLQELGPILAKIDEAAQQYKPQPQMPPDTSIQVAQMNLQALQQKAQQDAQLKQAEMQQKAQATQGQLQVDAQKQAQDAELAKAKLDLAQQQEQNKFLLEQFRQQQETTRAQQEMDSRERMNSADNTTAVNIATSEIISGEKVAVSTGTGLNPGS